MPVFYTDRDMRRRLVVFILTAMMAITLGAMMTLPEDAVLETLEPLDDKEIPMPSDPVAHTLNAAFGWSLLSAVVFRFSLIMPYLIYNGEQP